MKSSEVEEEFKKTGSAYALSKGRDKKPFVGPAGRIAVATGMIYFPGRAIAFKKEQEKKLGLGAHSIH